MPDVYTREQELLKRLRDQRCGGNAAELARKLKKDATYVNRLLYPVGKKGRKGIGLEVMRAATEAFQLPAGYWEGADSAAPSTGSKKGDFINALTPEDYELISHFHELFPSERREAIDAMAKLAEKRKIDRKIMLDEARLPEIMERAFSASSCQTESTSVDSDDPALKQRPLPGIE